MLLAIESIKQINEDHVEIVEIHDDGPIIYDNQNGLNIPLRRDKRKEVNVVDIKDVKDIIYYKSIMINGIK
jgi:hypothetical protein